MTHSGQFPPCRLPEGTLLRLKTQLHSLDAILADAGDDAIGRRPPEGRWSAHEHLAHLGRYHEVFLDRLERILTEDRPHLGRYRSEEDSGAGRWFALPAAEVLDRMRDLRGLLVDRVAKLAPEQWERIGVHPSFGEMPLALWIEFFLVHEGHHLYAILQRVRQGAA
jgi:hypothetical protein